MSPALATVNFVAHQCESRLVVHSAQLRISRILPQVPTLCHLWFAVLPAFCPEGARTPQRRVASQDIRSLGLGTLLRRSRTYGNYLSYVRLGCELVNVPTTVFDEGRARNMRKHKFVARGPMFLRLEVVRTLITLADGVEPGQPLTMLCLTSYNFMFRLPSEGLPITVNRNGDCDGEALISVDAQEAVLRLASRKNKPQGSTLNRGCWCRDCRAKGQCRHLQASGSCLAISLAAGEWRSPAFLNYLDEAVAQMHVEALLANSSDEDPSRPESS